MSDIPFLDLRAAYMASQAEYDAAYQRVMLSGRWILGPELEAFEQEFADYCGARHCVGVGNGLDALYLALRALGIGPGDEVIVPAHTFVATWLAVQRTGATPVPVEPHPDGFMPSAREVEAAITPRTRAVIAVHLYGSVAGIEEVATLCEARGIALVEDAAQAHGARSGRARAGSHGIAGCFSFYPGKNLGAFGDGGAVVCQDAAIAARLRALRNYGSMERYQHDSEGINSRLDELQAAMLRVRLRRLDADNAHRQALAALYRQELAGLPGLRLPEPGPAGSHVWHLFALRTARRDALRAYLADGGCQTLVHYPKPVYRHLPFHAHAPGKSSVSDRLTAELVSLPIGPQLTPAAVRQVCALIRAFLEQDGTP